MHAEAPNAAATDWAEIVGLYDVLARGDASPVIELNRAVAVAMRDGPAAGLALIDAILERGDLLDYRLAHAARAELCRRLGRTADARASYERALALTRQEPERRFLERRLAELRDRLGNTGCRFGLRTTKFNTSSNSETKRLENHEVFVPGLPRRREAARRARQRVYRLR